MLLTVIDEARTDEWLECVWGCVCTRDGHFHHLL